MLWDCFWGHFGTAVVATSLAEYCIQFLAGPCAHLLSQLTSNFHKSRYWGWQNSRWGDITRQLSSTWTSDLFTHTFTRVLSSQRCKKLTRTFCAAPPWTNLHNVAATRLVWIAVILNSSETNGPLSNDTINVQFRGVYKIFWWSKGGSSEPPWTPPAYGPVCHILLCTQSACDKYHGIYLPLPLFSKFITC